MFGDVFGDTDKGMRKHETGCNQLVLIVLVILGLIAIGIRLL